MFNAPIKLPTPDPESSQSIFYRPLTAERIVGAKMLIREYSELLIERGEFAPILDSGALFVHWLYAPLERLLAETDHEAFLKVCDLINAFERALQANPVRAKEGRSHA